MKSINNSWYNLNQRLYQVKNINRLIEALKSYRLDMSDWRNDKVYISKARDLDYTRNTYFFPLKAAASRAYILGAQNLALMQFHSKLSEILKFGGDKYLMVTVVKQSLKPLSLDMFMTVELVNADRIRKNAYFSVTLPNITVKELFYCDKALTRIRKHLNTLDADAWKRLIDELGGEING